MLKLVAAPAASEAAPAAVLKYCCLLLHNHIRNVSGHEFDGADRELILGASHSGIVLPRGDLGREELHAEAHERC